jgi:hypothetical protein
MKFGIMQLRLDLVAEPSTVWNGVVKDFFVLFQTGTIGPRWHRTHWYSPGSSSTEQNMA